MKKLNVAMLLALALQAGIAHADTVTEEVPDTLPGTVRVSADFIDLPSP
jgi:hypothetical protein